MKNNTVKTLGELELRELVDLGLRMPDGSTELFEVVNISDDCVTVMTKNIIDFMPFNERENKHSGDINSYAKSSVRKHLVELYQSVTKSNGQLLDNTIGAKEFFLPTAFLLGLGSVAGWQAFKRDSSRIKFSSKYSAQKTGSSNFLEEPSCYWLSESHDSYNLGAYIIHANGSLNFDCVYSRNRGIAPALNLEPSAPLVLNDGIWRLTEEKTSNEDSNTGIKIGDWIEVTHTAEKDIQAGILLGDCFEVTDIGVGGEFIIKPYSTKTWYLLPDQVRNTKPPLKNKNTNTIKVNEWVEVINTDIYDRYVAIGEGDTFKVIEVFDDALNVLLGSGIVWNLGLEQVKTIKNRNNSIANNPLTTKEKQSEQSNERLKGYYQHTAIEILKVYHTAHKVKEERIEALNKALENIQELIKLEKEND